MKFSNFGAPPVFFFVLSKKAEIGRLVDRGINYVMLPAMLPVNKYMWLMFYVLFVIKYFSFFIFRFFLLMPQATSLAAFKFALSSYKSE